MLSGRSAATLFLSVFLSLAFFSLTYAQVTTTAKDPAKDPANAMCDAGKDVPVDWKCENDGKGATNAKGELCMLRKYCREITEKKYLIEGRCRTQLRCSAGTYTENYPDCLKTKEGCKKRAVSLLFTNVKNETGAVPNPGTVQPPVAGTGTNVPWQSLPPQLTAQQITAAFENSAAKPLDAQYAVNPVTDNSKAQRRGQSGGSGDSNGATGLSTQASQNYNTSVRRPAPYPIWATSQVNEALGAPQSVQGSEFSQMVSPAEQKSEIKPRMHERDVDLLGETGVHRFHRGNQRSAQAGTVKQTPKLQNKPTNFHYGNNWYRADLFTVRWSSRAPAADVEVKIAANDMPRTGLAIIVENSTVRRPS